LTARLLPQRCRARVQTEWGLRCDRKATKTWKGIALCSQHEQVALRGNLNIKQDVVRDAE